MARGDSDAFLGPGFRFHPTDGNSSATTSSGRSLTSRYGLTRFPLLMSTDRSPGISLRKGLKSDLLWLLLGWPLDFSDLLVVAVLMG
ncbi:hypothetical protein LINPERHAP2_LOCUS28067 [Linum perenne]